MRQLRHLLVLPGIFFFCFTFLFPALAQENLAEVIKNNSVNSETSVTTGGDLTEKESRELVYDEITGMGSTVWEEDEEEVVCYLDGKEIAKRVRNGETWVWDRTGKIPNGLLKVCNKDGQLRIEYNLVDEKGEGLCKAYFKNGKVMSEGNFKKNVMEGTEKEYYENGNLKIEENYKSGNLNGIYKKFYENGQIEEEKNYTDGELNSCVAWDYKPKFDWLEKFYGEKGNLQMVRCWDNGKLKWRNTFDEHGKFLKRDTIYYHISGRVSIIGTAKSAKDEIKMDEWSGNTISTERAPFDGLAYYFYDKGDEFRVDGVKALSDFQDYEYQVKWYVRSGMLERTENYKDGKLDGESKSYENGLLKLERNFKNGELYGVNKLYYDSGSLQLETNWKNDKQSGIHKYYTENGLLYEESTWKDGKRDGTTKTYWENGDTIAYLDIYKNGEKINRKAYNVYGKLMWEQDYPYTLGTDKEENKQEVKKK